MKTFLDILSSTGRIIYFGKGLLKCVKEVVTIYNTILPNATWTLWSAAVEENKEM